MYTSGDATQFNSPILSSDTNLKLLPKTIERHRSLFAEQTSGLSTPQERILNFALEGPTPIEKLLRQMLIIDSNFVFGDLQWMLVVDQLVPLLGIKEAWDMNDEYKVSDLGHKIMEHKDNWMDHHSYNEYVGGALYRHWRRNRVTAKLIKG